MPYLPSVTSQISARSGRNSGGIDAYASPDAFGAAIGRSLGQAASGIEGLAGGVDAFVSRKRDEKVANTVAQSDFTPREQEVLLNTPADGAGLHDTMLQEFDKFVDEKANTIDDDVARTKYKMQMAQERLNVSKRSVTQQYSLDAQYSKQQADASIEAITNKVMTDPSGYDMYVEQGNAVIDTRTAIPAYQREAMKEAWRQNAAASRFTGMLEAATSVEDIDRASAELVGGANSSGKDDFVGKDWTKELSPQAFEQLTNKMGVARKEFITKADADARAAIDTIELRAKDVTSLIPQDELKAVAETVKKSRNPVTIAQFARIQRDQSIIADARKLPPAEQRAQINAQKGTPDTAFPGVPARVSNAINRATSVFDVSGSYLAATANREYGQYFKRTTRQTNAKFAPTPVHSGVDLRNVRPDVAEAATVAGELFGAPLQITSGYRSQAKQDSIRRRGDPNRASVAKHSAHTDARGLDISTVGMSPEDRGKLSGALVDAGFTGIGEYDTHIHADFRDSVPNSFGDKDGKTWGGWTYLSPPVAAALKERGFAANTTAKGIRRSSPVSYAEDINYGMGTGLTKDDGRPGSSAVGVFQHTDSTFLATLRAPGVAGRIGIDISQMSDAQILELRKDPDMSTMAAAALAEVNKKTMEGTLGRRVNDAELYMGHFLGAGGAITMLKARDQNPDQPAADILPKAAASNKPVFYRDGKPLTVEQVYAQISRNFVSQPSAVAYGDVQTRQKVLENTEKQIKENPVQMAQDNGTHVVPAFDVDNMREYGASVKSIAEYYNIPISEMKVLTPDSVDTLKKTLDEGSVDDTLAVMASMQNMGSDVARAALKQLGEKDNVYAYAGAMGLETGQSAVASDIIRGQKRMTENPDIKKGVGATEDELSSSFRLATGNALNEVSPRIRQDIQDAALAHYVETIVARGKGATFDPDAYNASVQAVVGSTRDNAAMGEVNGEQTLLPPGITADGMETAMQNMSVADWTAMSADGLPPRYIDGMVIDPTDLADEAKLRAIGQGQYKLQLDDGTFAVTGQSAQSGRLQAFIFEPDAKRVNELAVQVETPVNIGKVTPLDEWSSMPGTTP